jgi:nicotinamidase/pyrazinamidase
LAAGGKYVLVVWPEHCLVGSWGHNIHADVKKALDAWTRKKLKTVNVVIKGTNPGTEHYSAVRAEVPDPQDASTEINTDLIASLSRADRIFVAGEALSHCVASTVRDVVAVLPAGATEKVVLLTDCASSVGGFERLGRDFVAELAARGMRTATSTEIAL